MLKEFDILYISTTHTKVQGMYCYKCSVRVHNDI
jgi:hypothetical protein